MMKTVYMYVQDTMADWEHGYLMQALSLQTMLKKPEVEFKTVGRVKEPIKTAGGITLVPDLSLADVDTENIAALVLIGGETWLDEEQAAILKLAAKLLQEGILVAAICGATLGLADRSALNTRFHTSNAPFYPEMSPHYTGQRYYKEDVAVCDGNLITASSAGSLLLAKLIVEKLDLYANKTIEAWVDYFSTGDVAAYARLMASFSE